MAWAVLLLYPLAICAVIFAVTLPPLLLFAWIVIAVFDALTDRYP